jgi:hypothetical protein
VYNVRNNGLGDKDLFSYRVNTYLLATTGSDLHCCQTSLLSRGHWGILYPGVKRSYIYNLTFSLAKCGALTPHSLIPPVLRSKTQVCDRLIAWIAVSNLAGGVWAFFSCVCCVLCRQRPLRRAYHSFRGYLLGVCVCV